MNGNVLFYFSLLPTPARLLFPTCFGFLRPGVGGAQSRLPEIVKRKCYHVNHQFKLKCLQTESAPSIPPLFLLLCFTVFAGEGKKIDKGWDPWHFFK